ncbi:hypothetical protein [Rhizobium yanglingense]
MPAAKRHAHDNEEKLNKVVRRFPDDDKRYPSATLLAISDYEVEHAKPPAPEEIAQ